MAIPQDITRADMLKAIEMIDTGTHIVPSNRKSRGYCIRYDGKVFRHFPPARKGHVNNRLEASATISIFSQRHGKTKRYGTPIFEGTLEELIDRIAPLVEKKADATTDMYEALKEVLEPEHGIEEDDSVCGLI